MYRETLKSKDQSMKSQQAPKAIESKVNRICDAFLAVLEQPQLKEEHMQNIITAHVCKVPADLESGLEMIGRLQSRCSQISRFESLLNHSQKHKIP